MKARLICRSLFFVVTAALAVAGCGGSGGGGSGAKFAFKGKLGSTTVRAFVSTPRGTTEVRKNVSHVMAVNPESANPERVIGAVSSDGSFSLDVSGKRPWVLVFVDSSKVGKDMIVALVKLGTLDTLPVGNTTGEANLGDVSVDGTNQKATPGASLATLLSALGIKQETADVIGKIDDIAARYANPDIDGNGKVDLDEGKNYTQDFHIRFNHKLPNGADASLDDLVNAYMASQSTIQYTLGSAYGIWPTSYDSGTYVSNGSLTAGVTLTFPTGAAGVPGSYSQLSFGSSTGFGADWSSTEMAGSQGTPATYVYGFNGKTLTFTHVVTYSLATLNNNVGRIMPFVKFNPTTAGCTTACNIVSVEYKWMKYAGAGSGWIDATAEELALVVNDDGGFFSINKGPQANGKNISFKIPTTSLSGIVAWNTSGVTVSGGLTNAELGTMTTDELCHFGLSYDDKLGMRIFDGFQNGNNGC